VSFLFPAFLVAALAVALPIALHLLRRDVAPDMPFTAVRLLKKSPVERSRRRRLRDLLLLAARVTALLLLALAFARPFAPESGSAMMPLRIVAIDRSFSMGAPGALERARQLARSAVDEAAFGERLAVIGFDERADVLAQPGSAADARAAIASLRPSAGGTRYAAAVSKAAELASGGAATLLIVSDLQRAGWEGESRARVPSTLTVDVRDAGAPRVNLAIADARFTDDGLVATIRNASDGERTGALVLQHEGREAGRANYVVAAGASAEVPIRWKAASGAVVLAIDDPEGFAADNTRHLIAGTAAAPAVLVVTSGESSGFFLQRALEAAQSSGAGAFRAQLVTPAQIAGGRAESITRHRAVMVLSTRGLDRPAREAIAAFVKEGGGLFIAASPDVDPEVVASMFGWSAAAFVPVGEVTPATLAVTDMRYPIFRPFGGLAANLGSVRVTRAWRVDADGWHVSARFDHGAPALLDRAHGAGRIVLFATDLDRRWNDFPVHPAFVPFVLESVRHVASRTVETDVYTVGRVPTGIQSDPGIHRLESGRVIAVNVDTRESSIGVMTADEFKAMIEPVSQAPVNQSVRSEQIEARQSLWQYGLLLMLGVLVVESFVGRA
jgi:hypothetical protein